MKTVRILSTAAWLAAAGISQLFAAVNVQSLTPSLASPQPLGTIVVWTAKATDSSSNTLTFQYNVTLPNGTVTMVKDFNIGTLAGGVWTSQQFDWATIAGEGTYVVQVVAKDFVTGETATKTADFQLMSRVTGGTAVVNTTGNSSLVALFSAPSCASGSAMRVAFYTSSASPNYTFWANCQPSTSMNFYVAGMLPSTTYSMYSQTETKGIITTGPTLAFTTGPLPTQLPAGYLPSFKVNQQAPSGDPNPMLLWAFTKAIVPVATDLNGNIEWYYGNGIGTLLTRPVPGGTMLTIQNGTSWDSSNGAQQFLEEVDLAGNTVHQTNTGVISNELVAMGATDATPCGQIKQPPVVGDACLNDFHHDAIRYEIGTQQYTAFMAHVEKLFAPGTQGNKSGNPVDILSEMVIVLNADWQVVWYYDAFNQLDINRVAPLGEVCSPGTSDCPTNLFLGTTANDWTHANTVDYVSSQTKQNLDAGDFLVSMRDQDQVIRINYNNGAGSCAPPPAPSCIGWYMGPPDGLAVPPNSFSMTGTSNIWPWFSHQHDVTYANSGQVMTVNGHTGPLLTIFDNGNTRYSSPPLGLGSNCGPDDCYSRGMALIVDETAMTVTPVLLQSLGLQCTALGGAQLLTDPTSNNYFFSTGINSNVPVESIEIYPAKNKPTGTPIMNVQGSSYSYRGWQMPNLYQPPVL